MIYNKQYRQYAETVEQALTVAMQADDCPQREVEDAMRYSLLGGGKRLRGVLVLAFAQLFGGSMQAALPFACAVEMIHAYSLIHDDLPCMDNDELRRGKPTCHIRFGEAMALLAGDGLLTRAFELVVCSKSGLTAAQRLEGCGILAKAAGTKGMIGGQVLDIQSEGKAVEQTFLEQLHGMKTGAIIRASAELGCCAANANEQQRAAADVFAKALGLIFQITDDLLDVTATTQQLGKPVGSDAANKKTTYATLFGQEGSQKILSGLETKALDSLCVIETDTSFLRQLLQNTVTRTK